MISTLLANLVATLISRHSFYDQLKDQYLGEILKTETQQETTVLVVEENLIEKMTSSTNPK
jgi:hypothetical protein